MHGGHTADGPPGAPLHPGPVLSTTFHLGPPDAELPEHFYGRPANPTWTALEEAIGALDGGECVTFASGMAAVGAVLRLAARAGGAIVLPSDGYYVTRALAHTELAPLGVEIREVPTAGPWPDGLLDGATLLLVETPSNPGLDVCDIRDGRGRPPTPPARCWPSTTPPPPRSGSALSPSAPTSPSPATPRPWPATATCCSATSAPPTPRWPSACARPAPAAAPSPARWRPGSPTAASAPSTCAWPARPPTPRRWPAPCASTPP